MKRGWLVNAALLVAVAALGWFAHVTPPNDQPPSYALTALRADQVTKIHFKRHGRPTVVLQKSGRTWRIVAPFNAPADTIPVQRLLELTDIRSTHRFAAGEAGRFGLADPTLRISLNGERFAFGAVNAVMHEQYVLADPQVYAIEARYGAELPQNAEQLIRKQVFGEDEIPVRFELGNFTVMQSEGKWRLSTDGENTSQDDLARWVDEWRFAAGLRVEPYEKSETDAIALVTLLGGRTVSLGFKQRDSETVIERADEHLRYHFAADAARRLFVPPGMKRGEK